MSYYEHGGNTNNCDCPAQPMNLVPRQAHQARKVRQPRKPRYKSINGREVARLVARCLERAAHGYALDRRTDNRAAWIEALDMFYFAAEIARCAGAPLTESFNEFMHRVSFENGFSQPVHDDEFRCAYCEALRELWSLEITQNKGDV